MGEVLNLAEHLDADSHRRAKPYSARQPYSKPRLSVCRLSPT